MRKQWKQWKSLFSSSPKSLQMVTAGTELKYACSLEETYDKPRQCTKSRDITLPKKFHLVKAMVFPGVIYGYESWAIKKAEHQRTDDFRIWCWRRLLRVPWTASRSHQSILKEISPEYSLEGLMLKLQYFGSQVQRANSCKKTRCWERLKAKGEGGRGWDGY